jgi:outer membrane lipoprotein-sorting protein
MMLRRSTMHRSRNWIAILAAAIAAGCCTAGHAASVLAPDASVDQVLVSLHDRGQQLRSFTADVTHVETDSTVGNSTTRTGVVWYQLKPDNDARLHIVFDHKSVNDKPAHVDKVEYLLNDGWLNKRDYASRLETDYQVSHPGQKVNLFELGKGPFPLPIGQDPQAVRESFDVAAAPPAADDPAGTIHLKLTPRPQTDLARKFSSIDVWVDRGLEMPVRIETQGAANDGTDRQTDLRNLRVNPQPPLADAVFALPAIDKAWSVTQQPLDH